MFHQVKQYVNLASAVLKKSSVNSGVKQPAAKDAVFIWVPKVAGTSIWNAMCEFECPKARSPAEIQTSFNQTGFVTFGHQWYPQLIAEGLVSEDFDKRAYKFCFVRNPYDRAVSLFHYLKKTEHVHRNTSFKTFCHLIHDQAFDSPGLFNHKQLSQCNPQYGWITDKNGDCFVDYIGRYENLVEDFNVVSDSLGLSGSLSHQNSSARSAYQKYYNEECIQLIGEAYKVDCELFGYSFEQ